MGATKERKLELKKERNEKRLDELVKTNKYLANKVHYKNNHWVMAAWDSWAAQGKAGSCGCGCGYYNASLQNTRKKTDKGGGKSWLPEVLKMVCSDCLHGIEKRLGVTFKRF